MEYQNQVASVHQDTFLRRYKFNTETSLKSFATAERVLSDRYYHIEASDRQSLTTANKDTNEPTILPHIFFEKIHKGLRPQQQFRTELSALQLDNDQDNEYARWSGIFELKEDIPLTQGIGNYNATLMANYYEIHSQSGTARTNLGSVAQTNPSVSLGWRMPVSVNGLGRVAVIEPKAQVTYIGAITGPMIFPTVMRPNIELMRQICFCHIAIRAKTIFCQARCIDAGFSATANDQYLRNVTAFAGLSRRLAGTPSAGLNANQDDIYSDYVGSLSMSPAGLIDIRWSGRMSSHDFTINESKTVASSNFGDGYLSLTHSQLSQAYFAGGEDDREELSATFGKTIGTGWSVMASQIWDLSDGKTVRENSTAALNWAGGPQDCLTLTVNYEHDPNSDRDIGAVDQINFVLSVKHLGGVQPDTTAKRTNQKSGTNSTVQ